MNSEGLVKRKMELEELVEKVLREIELLPEGNLRIMRKRKGVQYYQITRTGDNHGKYIDAERKGIAVGLAQKSYYEKLLRELQREHKAIEYFLKNMNGTRPEDVYSSMNAYRKELIKPLLISDFEYGKIWMSEAYLHNPYRPEECIYETENNELVRSKTEQAIANMYLSLGVPYRYEAPVTLKDGKIKYPDFTLLKFPERKIIYHEHLGMLDDEEYLKANLIKLRDYEKSGIFIGDNLIITFETPYAPFNIKGTRNMVRSVLEIG